MTLRAHICRNIVVILTIWLGLATPSYALDTCDGRPCIAIGSYNIKLFGGGGSSDSNREIDKVVDRIAPMDVVVLQEINTGTATWRNFLADLQDIGFEVAVEGSFGGANPGRQQFVVVLVKSGNVQVVAGSAAELPIPTTNPPIWSSCIYDSLRPPVTVRLVAWLFDFRLVGLHFKSQTTVSSATGANKGVCDDDLRQWQSTMMLDELRRLTVADSDDDVVVVGDFNSPLSAEEFYPIRSNGLVSMIPDQCDASTQHGCSHLVSSSRFEPKVLDHIVVPSDMVEAVAESGQIGRLGTSVSNYRRTQSDHLEVWSHFYVDRDDD
mgnify:CR=1 FL=1